MTERTIPSSYDPIPHRPERIASEEVARRIREDRAVMQTRRSVRHFSRDPVPREVIEDAIRIAGTAPSGAHRQPWYFIAISEPELKAKLREAAEAEEREFYERRAPDEWLEALAPMGTDFHKEHLTEAPWVIVVFRRDHEVLEDGTKLRSYYLTESVGIAVGFLLSALHRAGLCALTHTPAPMNFLREVCGRPSSEKPFVIIPVGHAADDCVVPNLDRKPLEEIGELR